jgi:tRNA (mo5U34)-methyltransferase
MEQLAATFRNASIIERQEMSAISIDEARKLVASHHWKHSFEIVPGLVTKGDFSFIDSSELLDRVYGIPRDLSGMKALDIGALDGIHSFELERRGASVTAIDIQKPDSTGFNIAKRIIGSRAEYVQGSVYELSRLFDLESFDIILFFGVWYHLKNPVRAFEEVASVLKNGATVYAEGEVLVDYVEIDGKPGLAPHQSLAAEMGSAELAVSVYYPRQYKGDLWNWHVPNRACVSAWLETAGMKVLSHSVWHSPPNQRLHITARKDPTVQTTVDNPVW